MTRLCVRALFYFAVGLSILRLTIFDRCHDVGQVLVAIADFLVQVLLEKLRDLGRLVAIVDAEKTVRVRFVFVERNLDLVLKNFERIFFRSQVERRKSASR